MAGKTNYTDKGTKQRSLNLDDETYAIIEREAQRLHVTNSAALSMILHNFAASPRVQIEYPDLQTWIVDREPGHHNAATEAEIATSARNIVLPDERASTFEVSDPANAGKDGDPVKPGRRSVRTKHIKDDDILGGTE